MVSSVVSGTAAYHLEQLDPETGTVKNVDAINLGTLNMQDGYLNISAGENGILLLGIREEDYFPMAFDAWRDGEKIYGVTLDSFTENYWVSEELLEGGTPDIETLVANMLIYQGGKVMGWNWDERAILEFLLSGSEDLWGMIDWEEGACDFKSGLFGKMLEAAKKLKYDSEKNSQDQDYLLAYKVVRFYGFFERPETNTEGKVEAGWASM